MWRTARGLCKSSVVIEDGDQPAGSGDVRSIRTVTRVVRLLSCTHERIGEVTCVIIVCTVCMAAAAGSRQAADE